jgi:hypothetical protein
MSFRAKSVTTVPQLAKSNMAVLNGTPVGEKH